MERERRGFCGFIDIQNRRGAVMARRIAGRAAGHASWKHPVIVIIEKSQSEISGAVGAREGRSVLGIKPVCRIRSPHQREVALIPEMPDDVSRPGSVGVVDLQQPVLMSQRYDQISVV